MKTVLCIGGLDPAGRAGILADARAVAAMGAHPVCVAAALTFQSSRRVEGFEPVTASVLRRQIAVLLQDDAIDAVKIGQLGGAENVAVVLELPRGLPIVLDTPLVSSSNAPLIPPSDIAAYAPLLSRVTLATPNAVEVFLLRGLPPAASREDALTAARQLGAPAVLLKGGHLPGDEVEDILLVRDETTGFRSPRLPGRFRGTGCRLAAAIASRLAMGDALPEAIRRAHDWLRSELVQEAAA